jgi:hypothetical protein
MMPGQGCPRPPAGSARIWLQRRYYSERCRSHPPPRGGVSRENSRISWRMSQSDGPKALPPEGKGASRSIAQQLPDSCGRPRSTPGIRGNHQVCKPSAGPYDGRRSRPGSEPRLPSPSTRGKQGRSCDLRTTGWPASWVERTMTTSSSATSPCSSLTPPGPGWSICLLRRSPTGTTWSRPSLETSRARTCALGTPEISEAAASS